MKANIIIRSVYQQWFGPYQFKMRDLNFNVIIYFIYNLLMITLLAFFFTLFISFALYFINDTLNMIMIIKKVKNQFGGYLIITTIILVIITTISYHLLKTTYVMTSGNLRKALTKWKFLIVKFHLYRSIYLSKLSILKRKKLN